MLDFINRIINCLFLITLGICLGLGFLVKTIEKKGILEGETFRCEVKIESQDIK